MSIYLAVDCATEACSVALWLDGAVSERFEIVGREHTRRLLPMLQQLMADGGIAFSQVDGIACGVGPGSFAGVRIGVGVVKGIALARDIPVVGISSLAMMAQRTCRLAGHRRIAAVIDARMQEVYAGVYAAGDDGVVTPLFADQVCAAARVPPLSGDGWAGVGTGWGGYESELRQAFAGSFQWVDAAALPHAEDAVRLAAAELAAGRGQGADSLVPAYLRNRVALTLDEQRRSAS